MGRGSERRDLPACHGPCGRSAGGKKGVVYASKEAIHTDNPLVELAFDAGGVVWEATESADTRCWGLLPDKIQVLRLELPVGDHQLTLRAARGPQPLGPDSHATVHISQGRNTYMLANFPDTHMVGQILTGPRGGTSQ